MNHWPGVARFSAAAAAAFVTLILSTRGLGYAAALLLLVGPAIFWRQARPVEPAVRAELRLLFIACLALVGAMAIAILLSDASWRALEYPSRLLLLPLLAWSLAKLPFSRQLFWYGCALGAVGAAGLSFAQYLQGNLRPGGYQNPIMFGNLALTLAIFCLVAFVTGPGRRLNRMVLGIGLLAGLATNILAESRGGWLALLIALGVLLVVTARRDGRVQRAPWVFGVTSGILVLVTAIWLVGSPQRFLDIYENSARYFQGGVTAGNSEAERLEMWKQALRLWHGAPWFGIGPGNLDEAYAELARQGLMDRHASTYTHAHNQYLDMLAGSGVVGLTGFLLAMLTPVWLLARRLREAGPEQKTYAMAGIALIVLYLGFDLTQAMFAHNVGIMFYVVILAVCWRGALNEV